MLTTNINLCDIMFSNNKIYSVKGIILDIYSKRKNIENIRITSIGNINLLKR